MKNYTATITVTIPFEARNEEQSEERAEQLESSLALDLKRVGRWASTQDLIPEYETIVEED